MKKTIKWILLGLALTLATASCDDYLDITPEGQRKKEQQLSTQEGIEDALYGVYAQMRQTPLYGQELSFSAMEVLAQYMECSGNNTVAALSSYNYSNTYAKDLFESVWTYMYNNISNVNAILGSSLVRGATAYPYTLYRGEALALRAFMHFDLLRLFTEQITQNPEADGIPYATEFSLNTPDFVSAARAYELILADLTEAEQMLSDEAGHLNNGKAFMLDRNTHLNLYAVKALLARVYLTKGDKEKALAYALDVMENSGLRLSTKTEVEGDLAGCLSNNETLFGIYYGQFYANVSTKLQQSISFYSLTPRGDIMTYYDDRVTGVDYRATAYFTAMGSDYGNAYRLSKLTDPYELQNISSQRPASKVLGINMIRMPEMYYIAAECLLDDNPQEATRIFDEMLRHRGLEPLANWPDGQNQLTQEAINAERYREFIGEGQTFFNMKRQHLSITHADGTLIPASRDIYVVPVPDIEYEYRN